MSNEQRKLERKIGAVEDELLRCKDFNKQLQILDKLNMLRRTLSRMKRGESWTRTLSFPQNLQVL